MKPRPSKISGPVAVGLALAVALDTVIQISWKLGVAGIPADAPALVTLRAAVASPWFFAAMLAFGAQVVNWLQVLKRADLSFAQPFTALSYVTVLTLSSRSLHEDISAVRLLGVGLILLGIFFISRTAGPEAA